MTRTLPLVALSVAMALCGAVPARAAAITIFDPGVNSELAIRWGSGGGEAFIGNFVVTCPIINLSTTGSDGTADCTETPAGVSFSGTFNSPNHAQLGTYNANFYESAGGPVSDTLTLTLRSLGGDLVEVTGQFISDVDGGPGLTPLANACAIDEGSGATGCVIGPPDGQFVLQTGNWIGVSDFTLVANSDTNVEPATVPEPASLFLFGTGLFGAGLFGAGLFGAGLSTPRRRASRGYENLSPALPCMSTTSDGGPAAGSLSLRTCSPFVTHVMPDSILTKSGDCSI